MTDIIELFLSLSTLALIASIFVYEAGRRAGYVEGYMDRKNKHRKKY